MDSKARLLNPHEASRYLETLRKDQKLMALIRYHHQFDWSKSEGLQQNEVKVLASRCRDSELRELFELMLEKLIDNDQSTLIASNGNSDNVSESNVSRKSYVLYAEKHNDKYNIITANAIQTKEIDWGKLKTISLASASVGAGLGAIVGSTAGPVGTVVGGFVGGSVGGVMGASGVAGKAYHDYHQIMPEAVYGYILQELQEKQVLRIHNNKFTLHHSQN
jgi:hypothetical protein